MRNLSKTEKVKESIQRWIAIILLAITLLNNFSALAFTLSEYETLTAESSISDGQNNENNGEEEPVATASPEPEEPITTSRPNRVTSNNSTTNNDTNTSVDDPGAEDPIVTPPPIEEPTEEEKSIAMIASGYDFTIALDGKGRVWAWGENGHGQLGNGTLTAKGIKKEVTFSDGTQLSNVKQISAGLYHAAALTNDGKVYIWGYNYYGQTGSTSYKNILNPILVEGISGIAKEVSCGARFTTILTEDNKVYGVGDSNNGQLGYYNPLGFTSIREIEELKPEKELPTNIKSISAGGTYLVMLDEAGVVYTVGGLIGTAFDFSTIKKQETPAMEKVVTGNVYSIGLGKDGLVYTWSIDSTPTQVSLNGEATDIGINNQIYHAIVNNELYSWGTNNFGQAGVGNNTNPITTPTKITTVGSPVADTINTKIDKISSSPMSETIYAINEDGYVLGWGYAGSNNNASDEGTSRTNNYKLLGAKTRNYADYIGFITLKEEFNNITMNVGDTFAFNKMLTEKGIISGEEKVNLYKDFETNYSSITTKVVNENIATLENGILTGVAQGQTYIEIKNPTTGRSVLVKVTVNGNEAYAKLETRDNFTVGLKSDGTVWVWGYNKELGIEDTKHDGSGFGIILPTKVEGLENVKDISVGQNHVLALKKDGTVVAWGVNTYGQLGNNSTDRQTIEMSAPTVVMKSNYQEGKQEAPALSLIVESETQDQTTDPEGAEGETPVVEKYTDGTDVYYKEGSYYRRVSDSSYAYKIDTDGITYKVNTAGEFTKALVLNKNGTPLTNIVKVVAGDTFSIAVDAMGDMYTWGANDCLQLANGLTSYVVDSQNAAIKMNISDEIKKEGVEQIEAARSTGYILTSEGNIYAWGNSANAQCGTVQNNVATPTKVNAPKKVSKIAVSMDGTGLAIGTDGKVYGWGYNQNRIFGNIGASSLSMTRLDMIDINVADIAVSATGAIAITADNRVIAWGRNYATNTYQVILQNGAEPMSDITAIGAGNDFYTMAKADGTIWTSGVNNFGQLGNRTTTATALNMAEEISKAYVATNISKVDLKVGQTATIEGKYSYGFNLYNNEEKVNLLNGTSFDTTVATISNNTITAVGSGKTYVVVEDSKTNTQQIVEVNVLNSDDITIPEVSNGYDHTVALKTNGDVYIWGNNTYGQLGIPSDTTPVLSKPELMDINKKALDVAAGQYYTLIVTEDGKVLATGYNAYGQLGNNSTTSSNQLVNVLVKVEDGNGNVTYEELTNIVKVVTDGNVSMALDKQGNVYAWGYGYNPYATKVDTYGLKVKDIEDKAIITEDSRVWILNGLRPHLKFVPGLDNVATISTSVNDLYVASTTSGEVYTWKKAGAGANYVTDSIIPVKNETLANIVDVAAAGTSAFAIDKDRNVYAWGYNGYSELGLGSTVAAGQVTVPTVIPDFKAEMISVSKNASRPRVITEIPDGTVYAWGYNADGMLGKGDTQGYSEPALIGDSYVGFVVDGKVVNRISMPINSSKTINASIITGLNLRRSLTSVDTNKEFTWQMMNEDGISVSSNKATATVTAKGNMGEAVLIATDPETGKTGKLYIDITKNSTNKVTPKVETFGNHSVALKADGTVWAWGYTGELGLTNSEVLEPVKVDIDETIVDIATSTNHTLLLTESGEVYSFGNNGNYQLGRFDGDVVGKVKQSTGEVLKDIVKVAAGPYYSLALDKEGNIWTWGQYGIINASAPIKLVGTVNGIKISEALTNIVDITKHYALDTDGNVIDLGIVMKGQNVVLGTKVAGITGKVKEISTGINHSLFLTEAGTVYAAGSDNTYGQLGNDTVAATVVNAGVPTATQVLDTLAQPLTNIVDISAGSMHSLAVDKAGNVYAWGSNRSYQLSDRIATNNDAKRARKVTAISDVAFVSAGVVQSVVVKNDGTVYAWGTGNLGQLGNKLTSTSIEPVRVGTVAITTTTNHITLIKGENSSSSFTAENRILNLLYPQTVNIENVTSSDTNIVTVEKAEKEVKVKAVNVGTASIKVTAVSENGEQNISIVQVTVLPEDIELAEGYFDKTETTDETTGETTTVSNLSDKFKTQIITPMVSTTGDHTLVLKSDGTVWSYGKNQYGQLGNGTTTYSDEPVEVIFPVNAGAIVNVAAGEGFSVAVDINGRVWTWGRNTNGELGLGVADNVAYTTPCLVTRVSGIAKVEAGANHVIALSRSGYAYAWGKNTSGSLGIAGSSTVPQQIATIADVIDVKAGEDHSLILTADGKVYSAGRNANGQLGVGTDKPNRNTFEIVPINATIARIAAGKAMSFAVDTDGKVWAWGRNTSGQLGLDLASEWISTPTKVSAINGNANYKVADVSAGTNTAQVLMSSGELYMAGANNLGQLGNNRANDISRVFTKVNTLGSNVLNATTGNEYSAVITKNGCVWGFGDYNQGALSYKSRTNSDVPVRIYDNVSSVEETEITVRENGTKQLNANGKNKFNALHKDTATFIYETVNPDIATVDETTGIVTGVKVGTTWVKAIDDEGKQSITQVKVIEPDATVAAKVDGGENFTGVIDETGILWTFGALNLTDTSLGNAEGTTISGVPIKTSDIRYKDVAIGDNFAVAIDTAGNMWSWGQNADGQLGLGDYDNRVSVNSINTVYYNGFTQISAGDNHVVALDNKGILYAWGDNKAGQLGISKTTKKVNSPMIIAPCPGKVVSISAGGNNTAIVDASGKVYLFGSSTNGAIKEVPNVNDAVRVVTSDNYTMILTTSGKVKLVTNSRLTTTQIESSFAVDIALEGTTYSYIDKDGNLFNGSTYSNKPTNTGIEDAFEIGLGNKNQYYINTSGAVYAKGDNQYGQLGNGSLNDDNSSTKLKSDNYVKVGQRGYKLVPSKVKVAENWDILVGNVTLKELLDSKTKFVEMYPEAEFNVFRNSCVDMEEYEFSIKDTSIAEVTDSKVARIKAKAIGQTVLEIKDKVTNTTNELTIYVVTEEEARINGIKLEAPEKEYEAEVENATDYIIYTDEGSGNAIIDLAVADTLRIKDGDNYLTNVDRIDGTNKWILPNVQTDTMKEYTLELYPNGVDQEPVYRYTLRIVKGISVEVNSEILVHQDKVFTKYINPEDTTAKVEIEISKDAIIRVEHEDGRVVKQSAAGEKRLVIDAVEVPNVTNKFIIRIIEDYKETDQYTLVINKSSIGAVTVTEEYPVANTRVIEGTDRLNTYVREYTVKTDERNNPVNLNLNVANKNVTKAMVDGEETQIVDGKISIEKEIKAKEGETTGIIVDIEVEDPITLETYVEKYLLKVQQVSANTKITNVQMIELDSVAKDLTSKASKDGKTHGIVLHDENLEINNMKIKVNLESAKAKFGFDVNSCTNASGAEMILSADGFTKDGDNRLVRTIYVQAENGDIASYDFIIYGRSENADIEEIKSITQNPTDERVAVRKEGTNAYDVVVIKNKDNYEVQITLEDAYANIVLEDEAGNVIADSFGKLIDIDGNEYTAREIKENEDGTKTYVYEFTKDILGKEISIKVQPEYTKLDAVEYKMTIREMSSNSNIEYITVNANPIDASATVKAKDEAKVEVKAENDYATIEIYAKNPDTYPDAEKLFIGTGKVEGNVKDLLENGDNKFYVKVISEDGTSNIIKEINVYKQSDNAELDSISVDPGAIAKDIDENGKIVYKLQISDDITSTAITVVPEDSNATVTLPGNVANGSAISIDGLDSVNITITSEDGTVTKEYVIVIDRLSSDATIKEIKVVNNDKKENKEPKYTQTVDENKYEFEVNEKWSGTKLSVTLNEPNAKIKGAVVSKDGTTISAPVYTDYKQGSVEISLPDNSETSKVAISVVDLIVEAVNGTETRYKVLITPKHSLEFTAITLKVFDASSTEKKDWLNSQAIIDKDLADEKIASTVYVHPNADSATIQVQPSYSDVYVTISYNTIETNTETGEDTIKTVEYKLANPTDVYKIAKLNKDDTVVTVKMEAKDGSGSGIYNITISRGENTASLEGLSLESTQSNFKTNLEYSLTGIKENVIKSVDDLYKVIATTKDNATIEIYDVTGIDSVVDATLTEDKKITDLDLSDGTTKRIAVKVTSQFKDVTQIVVVDVRKASDDATITALDVMSSSEKLPVKISNTPNEEGYYDIAVISPGTIDLSLNDITLSSDKATVKSTTIGISTKPTTYKEITKPMTAITGELGRTGAQRYQFIEVTAENGISTKVYKVTYRKASKAHDIGDIEVYDQLNKKVNVNNNTALVSIFDNKATIKAVLAETSKNGVAKLAIQSINGLALKEEITANNEYEAMFNADTVYVCIDSEGNDVSIAGDKVTEMGVKVTYISEYADLFNKVDTPENSTTVTIKRVNKDTNFVITLSNPNDLDDDGNPKVIATLDSSTIADINDIGEFIKTLSLPSNLTDVIVAIDTTTKYNATVKTLTGVDTENKVTFDASVDKESKQLIITMLAEDEETENTYIITLQEQSFNTNVTEIKVNEKTATKVEEQYEQPILSSEILVNKNLVVNATKEDTNATAKVKITKVNGTAVTTTAVENGESLYAELEKVSSDLSTVTEVTVEVTVTAEDTNVTKTYTVNIPVIGLSISSIHLTDDLGNGYDLTETTDPKITASSVNKFKNDKDILVPNNANTLTINEEDIVLSNENVTIVTEMPLTITIGEDGKGTAVIVTSMGEEYTITVRRKTTETSISSISVDNETATKEEESGNFKHDIGYTAKPEIIVTTKDPNATVSKVEIYYINAVGEEVNLEDCSVEKLTTGGFKFNITNIDGLYNHDTEITGAREQRELKARITVKSENGLPENSYTLSLSRKDENSELKSITFTDTEEITVLGSDFDTKKEKKVELATSEITNNTDITLNSLVASCKEAEIKAYDKDGNEIELEQAITVADGTEVVITIVVKAEYKPDENNTTYTLKLYRKSSNSEFDTVYMSDKEIPTDNDYKAYSKDEIYDAENDVYKLNVDVDKDPTIKLNIPSTAEISAVKAYAQTPGDLDSKVNTEIDTTVNNKFAIYGLSSLYVDDDTEDAIDNINRVITVEVTVKPEEGAEKTYTFRITRVHIDATLPISYSYVDETGTQTGTETFTEATTDKKSKELFVPGATTEVVIGAIVPSCDNATIKSVAKKVTASGVETTEAMDATVENTLTFANEGDSVELTITVQKENTEEVVYTYTIIRSSTDASLTHIKVDNIEAQPQTETEEGFDKVYKVSVANSSPSAIEILSANASATVEIVNTTNYTTTPNDKTYKEEGKVTYSISDTEKVIEIQVTPQDETQAVKYKLYIELVGTSSSIKTIDIKDVNGNTLYAKVLADKKLITTNTSDDKSKTVNRYDDGGDIKSVTTRTGNYYNRYYTTAKYKVGTYIYTLPANIGEFKFDNLIPDTSSAIGTQTYTILENTNSLPNIETYDYQVGYTFNRDESKQYGIGDVISIEQGILKTYTIRVTSEDGKSVSEYDVIIVRKTDNTELGSVTLGDYTATKNKETGEWEIKVPKTLDTGRLTIQTKQQVSGISTDIKLNNTFISKANWYDSTRDGRINNTNGVPSYKNTYKEYGRTTTIKSNIIHDLKDIAKLDMVDNKEITIGVTVTPQDKTNKAATQETIRIIRQYMSTELENVTITDNNTSEATSLTHTDFKEFYKMVKVPSTTTSVTLSDIRGLAKENVTIKAITVAGVAVEDVTAPFNVELAEEGKEVTVVITTKAETGATATYTLVIRRMMTSTDVDETNGVIVSNATTGAVNEVKVVNEVNFEAYINPAQVKTKVGINPLNSYATVNASVKQILDAEGRDITSESSSAFDRVQNDLGEDINEWTLDTVGARKYILEVEITPEDTVNGETRTFEVAVIIEYTSTELENVTITGEGITEPANLAHKDFDEYKKTYQVPSTTTSVTLSDIRGLAKENVTIKAITVAGELVGDLTAPINVELPEEGTEVTVVITTKAETGDTKDYTLVIRRMMTTNDLEETDGMIVSDNDTGVINELNPVEGGNFEVYITEKQENTRIQINPLNSEYTTVNVAVKEVRNSKDEDVTSEFSSALDRVQNDEGEDTNEWILATRGTRKYILTVEVIPEDSINGETRTFELTIIIKDTNDNIEFVKVNEVEAEIDKIAAHYPEYENKNQEAIDDSIYVMYIDMEETVANIEVQTESNYTDIQLSDKDGVELVKGLGNVKYTIDVPGVITETRIKVAAEDRPDGYEPKEYTLYIIKKSDDTSIKSVRVFTDEEKSRLSELEVKYENGEYYVEVSDSLESIWVEAIPNYESALVSINAQSSEWKQSTRQIDLIEASSDIVQERDLYKDIIVYIPAAQSLSGVDCRNPQVIHIKRVSSDNGIESIKTGNNDDRSGGENSVKETINGETVEIGTWTVTLGGTTGTTIDTLEIKALSEKAKVELYDNYNGTLIESAQIGVLTKYGFTIAEDERTTVWAKVTPEQGDAKWHRIEIEPKGCSAELYSINIGGNVRLFTPGQYRPLFADLDGITESIAITATPVDPETDIEFSDLRAGVWTTGEATIENVNILDKKDLIITTRSSNKKYTRTYTIRLTELSEENGIENITFTNNGEVKEAVIDEAGRYIVEVDSLTNTTDIKLNLIDKEYATVEVFKETLEGETAEVIRESLGFGLSGLTVTERDLLHLNQDIIRKVVVTAQNEEAKEYELVIRKHTAVEGTVITENVDGNHSNVQIHVINSDTDVEKYKFDIINDDGTFHVALNESDLESNIKITVTKQGFLTHTIDVPAIKYGTTYYVGDMKLMGGNVYQKNGEVDDVIDYRDLGQMNRAVSGAKASTTINLDLNEDGKVDDLDLDILVKNYDRKAINNNYVRNIKIKGQIKGEELPLGTVELLNAEGVVIQTARISETGEFTLININMTDDGETTQYALRVNNAEGEAKTVKPLFVRQDMAYELVDTLDNTNIAVTHSLSILPLDITVGEQRIAISNRDEKPSIDVIAPKLNITEMKYTMDGISIKANTNDDTALANIKITIDDEEKYSGTLNGTNANIEKAITLEGTTFGKEHNIVIEIADTSDNIQKYEVTLADSAIRTADDVSVLKTRVNSGISYKGESVELVADIDISDIEWWESIGTTANPFMGTFEGNGHVITGLTIRGTNTKQGLFGSIDGATIRNLGMEGNDITVKGTTGAIVGEAKNSTIENCYSSINMTATGNSVSIGGIVGKAENTLIKNCYNTGAISGYTFIGGIVGEAKDNVIVENCYNAGTITASKTSDAIIGNKTATSATITIANCYETLPVTANELQASQQEVVWVEDTMDINNGNPILKWQQVRAEEMAKEAEAAIMSIQSEDTSMVMSAPSEVTAVTMSTPSEDLSMILPVTTKYTVTSEFGPRTAPTEGASTYHSGMDIAAEWQSEILAVADGVVTFAGEQSGYGYCIEIKHEINGNTVYSFYAHLYERKVKEGDIVSKGQIIALEGGRPGDAGSGTSTGPHLHFEIRNASKEKVNPRDYIKF